jgi:hypothetical protein
MLSWYFAEKPLLLWGWDMRVGAGDIYVYPVHYSLYDTSGPARASYSLMKALHFWLFACALLSVLFIARKGPDESSAPAVIYGSVLLVCSVYVMAQSEPRYSIPLRPEMYILATYFIRRLYTAYQGYRSVSADLNRTTRET